jgi:hypothetical protein
MISKQSTWLRSKQQQGEENTHAGVSTTLQVVNVTALVPAAQVLHSLAQSLCARGAPRVWHMQGGSYQAAESQE